MFAHDGSYEGFPACAETLWQLWHGETDPTKKSYFKSRLDKFLDIFKRYSKLFPNGLPSYHRILCQYLWSQQQTEAARQAIARSEACAEQYEMIYEAALAQAWRGRLRAGQERRDILQHARTRLHALGAVVDVDHIASWGEA
ncbi:MAG TPA: hypothetical protein PKI03_36230 [Pseudomonadota bacterium]|nr:hypothetical protein [Pseudomonadota bacterium]